MKRSHLHTLLLVAIVIINGYIIITPLMPAIAFRLHKPDDAKVAALEAAISPQAIATGQQEVPRDNRLIIPSIALDESIHTGNSARTLKQGLWLRPQGSTPKQGSNTVIAGHRFTYTNPRGAFYHLDKVAVGDHIAVAWEGTMHQYKVIQVKIVKANDTAVEDATPSSRLTLYTCTPLWLPKDRLVIIAEQEHS